MSAPQDVIPPAKRKRGAKGQHAEPPIEAQPTDPTPAEPIIEPPAELGPVARREWDRLIPHLAKTGVLTEYDRGPLAIYCVAFAIWLEAIEAIQKYGAMIKSPNGFPIQSPYLATANKQAEITLKVAADYGFTPASRDRKWMLVAQPSSMPSELLPLNDLDLAPWPT